MIKVLIVEDDPMVLNLNKRYIETVDGFKVVETALNGKEALRFLTSHSVDLVIADIYMPHLDGISFLKEMRRRMIKADVIFVTAAKETDSIDEVLMLGAVDYLIKPFEYERLKSSLESYYKRYQLLKRNDVIKQEDIDQITKRGYYNIENTVQKGLHKKTLERIRNFMKKNEGIYFTSEEVSEKLHVSRVTVRRYLEYLVSISELTLEIEYGSIGRPSHLYKHEIK
ncbi:response regulator [Serpentinicella alkaliphila]|uniref:Transcriptional regulatory protein n=1 Tax=Serpentinicella alkaliphila TaxID=1734049 RepID=A0A4R2TNT4_9FIRM|nr:response regulator [Serpentinicella alkaliphila]QUH27074.1 response regulator [Serpentinicella alkaliphila]TCQ05201.1 two-component system CitB family response regulator/two-component system response regulator DctR [Serpentinicella alkaliphila]